MACISLLKRIERENQSSVLLDAHEAQICERSVCYREDMTEEQIKAEPAAKGLMLSNAIFEADTSLKTLSVEERFEARLE